MQRSTKEIALVAGLILSLLVICILACYGAFIWTEKSRHHSTADKHEQLHQDLGVEHGEIPALDQIEEDYAINHSRLIVEMKALQAELAQQLLEKTETDAELTDLVRRIHEVHGAIQHLSIEHFFEMMKVLPESKRQRLRTIAAESLSKPD